MARRVSVLPMLLAVAALAGCAEPSAVPRPASTPASPEVASPTPTQSVDAAPQLFDVDCTEVMPIDALEALHGQSVTPLREPIVSLEGPIILLAAAANEGALYCRWSLAGVERLGDVTLMATAADEATFAIDAAGDEGYTNPGAPTGVFPRDREYCSEDSYVVPGAGSCEWSVYSDGVWAVFAFEAVPSRELVPPTVRVRPDGSISRPTPKLDGDLAMIVRNAMAALVESRTSMRPQTRSPMSCATLLADPLVAAAVGAVEEVYDGSSFRTGLRDSSTATLGGGIPFYAAARAGWSQCGVQRVDGDAVTIRIVPNGAELLDGLRDAGARDESIGREALGGCFSDEGGSECRVAVAAEDDLVVVLSRDPRDLDISLAQRVATAVVDVLTAS